MVAHDDHRTDKCAKREMTPLKRTLMEMTHVAQGVNVWENTLDNVYITLQ